MSFDLTQKEGKEMLAALSRKDRETLLAIAKQFGRPYTLRPATCKRLEALGLVEFVQRTMSEGYIATHSGRIAAGNP